MGTSEWTISSPLSHPALRSFSIVRLDMRNEGHDLRTIQKWFGHNTVKTTEIYTHVPGRGAMGVISPIDDLR